MSEPGTSSLARSTALMTLGTVLSRVTGVLRLAVLAGVLGIAESRLPDAYNLANTVPNILYELLLGAVVASLFVPLFVEILEKEERDKAWEVFSAIINVSLLAITAIAVVGVLLSPLIAEFYAARLGGDEVAAQERVLTVFLRLFIPQIILYGMYFIFSGLLNADKTFVLPMFTPIVNNFVAIGVFVAFGILYGTVGLENITTSQLLLLGIGTTASVAPGALLLLPAVRKLGHYRLTLKLDHPSVRKLARLSVYAIGYVAANQIGYIVIQWLANEDRGAYTAYLAAFTFFLLPIGLFTWSLTTALVPSMSEEAVRGNDEGFRDRVETGIGATIFLLLPCAVGYIVLGEPIADALLRHGIVTGASIDLVVGVLDLLSLGLVQFGIFLLLVRAFYARQDTKTPFWVNAVVIAVNTAINIPMFAAIGVEGLAAGHAVAYTIGSAILLVLLGRSIGWVGGRSLQTLFRCAIAAGATGAVAWAIHRGLTEVMGGADIGRLAALSVAVAVGAGVYLFIASALRVKELDYVREVLGRRFVRGDAENAAHDERSGL